MTTTMRLLLDMHVFLWRRDDSRKLKMNAPRAIAEAQIVFVRAATAREAAIKSALGRLQIPDSVEAAVIDSGFEKLPIRFSHAGRVALCRRDGRVDDARRELERTRDLYREMGAGPNGDRITAQIEATAA